MKQKTKLTKKKVSQKNPQRVSKWLIIGIIILFISLFILVISSGQRQEFQGNAATGITPTFGAIGDCQAMGNCPTGSIAPSNTVVSSAPAVSAAPSGTTVQPCTSTAAQDAQVSTMSKNRRQRGTSGGGGFLQMILQFLRQLLQLLQQLLGGGTVPPTTGNPQPSAGVPNPSGAQPSGAPNPSGSPCPPASGAPQPTQPTTQQPTGVPTSSVPAPTAPVTSSNCTNPKYTIPMDPNDAQAGVTIGNFYLTADTWNAKNYQLTQTVYACDYNNWYAVANMNNNSGDGAVKTSPNVHEDINKPLSSLKTITSTFAESGPHVGIYEYEYDLWLNGFGNGSTEVMIWVDNFGQTPSGSKQGTFTDNGHTYDVYSTGNGYVAFVAQNNFTSGSVNILNFFNYVVSKGWAASSSTVSQLDFGVELVSTGGSPATFKVTNFSLTAN